MAELHVLGTGGATPTAERDNTAFALDFCALELGKLAQEWGVRLLIPCHFFGEVDFLRAEVEEEIRGNYRGRLIIPRDMQRIRLSEP